MSNNESSASRVKTFTQNKKEAGLVRVNKSFYVTKADEKAARKALDDVEADYKDKADKRYKAHKKKKGLR